MIQWICLQDVVCSQVTKAMQLVLKDQAVVRLYFLSCRFLCFKKTFLPIKCYDSEVILEGDVGEVVSLMGDVGKVVFRTLLGFSLFDKMGEINYIEVTMKTASFP